jgi:hypothetical protein
MEPADPKELAARAQRIKDARKKYATVQRGRKPSRLYICLDSVFGSVIVLGHALACTEAPSV